MSKKNQPEAGIFHIVAFAFEGQKTAGENLKEAKKNIEGYKIIAQAIIERDEKGKVHWHEPGKGGVGAAAGAVAGGLLGLIGGPAGLLAWTVGGSVVGGLAGRHFSRLVDPKDLKTLAAALDPDTSAFMVLVEDVESEKIINSMEGFSANVITLTVGDELSGEIAQFAAGEVEVDAGEAGDE
jgi:uncharacterized membrane protein